MIRAKYLAIYFIVEDEKFIGQMLIHLPYFHFVFTCRLCHPLSHHLLCPHPLSHHLLLFLGFDQ